MHIVLHIIMLSNISNIMSVPCQIVFTLPELKTTVISVKLPQCVKHDKLIPNLYKTSPTLSTEAKLEWLRIKPDDNISVVITLRKKWQFDNHASPCPLQCVISVPTDLWGKQYPYMHKCPLRLRFSFTWDKGTFR